MIKKLIELAESGIMPDFMIRAGIVKNCKNRIRNEVSYSVEELSSRKQRWIEQMINSPIALVPDKANEQHYEVPSSFFENVLGENLKYSSGYWPKNDMTLNESELAMLKLSVERAELRDGQSVLELGCGWGSLTCFMAERYPSSSITAVSNSKDQKKYIEKRCEKNGIKNVNVITADMNEFQTDIKFDRVVSIEMFEHMRNYKSLLSRIHNWLNDNGKLFIHIFSHKSLVYPFEDNNEADWMAREFFSGGMMPSHDLLLYFQDDLKIEETWRMPGSHYEKTSIAWLNKMDMNSIKVKDILAETYGEESVDLWIQRWRIFFMSCEKLFGYGNGSEWGISHYRFTK